MILVFIEAIDRGARVVGEKVANDMVPSPDVQSPVPGPGYKNTTTVFAPVLKSTSCRFIPGEGSGAQLRLRLTYTPKHAVKALHIHTRPSQGDLVPHTRTFRNKVFYLEL